MANVYTYFSRKGPVRSLPNQWDLVAFILVLGIIALLGWGAKTNERAIPYWTALTNYLSSHLPEYALLTVLRMFIAIFFSLLFTFTIGTWAAKSRSAEKIIIPCIDILQICPSYCLSDHYHYTFYRPFSQ